MIGNQTEYGELFGAPPLPGGGTSWDYVEILFEMPTHNNTSDGALEVRVSFSTALLILIHLFIRDW